MMLGVAIGILAGLNGNMAVIVGTLVGVLVNSAFQAGEYLYPGKMIPITGMLSYLMPGKAYGLFVAAWPDKWRSRLESDFCELWIMRTDMNSTHQSYVRLGHLKKAFPDAEPTTVWRTADTTFERIFFMFAALVMGPTVIVIFTWFILQDAYPFLWQAVSWLAMFTWMIGPAYKFGKAWSEPRAICVQRIREVPMDEAEELVEKAAAKREGREPVFSKMVSSLSTFQDEYIEGGYSTEFAAMTMEAKTLREYAQYDFVDGGWWGKIPKEAVVIGIIILLAAYFFYDRQQSAQPPPAPPPVERSVDQ